MVADADLEMARGLLVARPPTPAGAADACLACGQVLQPEETRCSVCGWSWTGPEDVDAGAG